MRRICFFIFAAVFLLSQPISQGGEPSSSNPSALMKTDGQKSMAAALSDVAGGNLYTLEYDQPYHIDDIMDCGGVNSSKALLTAVFSRLVNLPTAVSGGTPEFGCSIFSVKSPEGDVLVGRNFDFSFASSSNILVHNVLPGVRESVGTSRCRSYGPQFGGRQNHQQHPMVGCLQSHQEDSHHMRCKGLFQKDTNW